MNLSAQYPKITLDNIREAILNEELQLYFQPKVSMVTGELSGAEALIRWVRADGTIVPPVAFIPMAERSDLIVDITHYVFKKLIIDFTVINAINSRLSISFNASGRDFYDSKLTQLITEAIQNKSFEPGQIELEVTETVFVNEDSAHKYLNQLADLGMPIAMDDFGTGHSGLVKLSKWPFSIIKIDQKFIKGINKSSKDREIMQASIRMAHQLNLDVVAEGIEDRETYRVLQEYGCKIGQGYWISKPLPLADFLVYLRQFKKFPAMPIGLLYMAQLDHIQWRKTLIDTALFLHSSQTKRKMKNLRGLPEQEHTNCKLGRWYYGTGTLFKGLPEYQRLEQPHIKLHSLGKQLLQVAQEHCDMNILVSLIQKLSEESLKVLEALQSLETNLHVSDCTGSNVLDVRLNNSFTK